MSKLKEIFKEVYRELLKESSDLIRSVNAMEDDSTLETFVQKFIGKSLDDILDASSYANLYNLNKMGIGGDISSREEPSRVLTALLTYLYRYVRKRKLSDLEKERQRIEYEYDNNPEILKLKQQQNQLRKKARDEYFDLKQRLEKELGADFSNFNNPELDAARKKMMSTIHNFGELAKDSPVYKKYVQDRKDYDDLINDVTRTKLLSKDLLPSPTDTQEQKELWKNIEKEFEDLKKLLSSKNSSMYESHDEEQKKADLDIANWIDSRLKKSLEMDYVSGNYERLDKLRKQLRDKWKNEAADLSNDVQKDIEDLKKLIKNPDVKFAEKNYGSVDAYKRMLAAKIAKLKHGK